MLVGNKCDLERKVSRQEIDQFCSNKKLKYVETSSTEHTKTQPAFQQLAEDIIQGGYYKGLTESLMPQETILQNELLPNKRSCLC